MGSMYRNRLRLLVCIVLALGMFLTPFQPQPQTGTLRNTQTRTAMPKLPNFLEPIIYHDLWFYISQWLHDYARWVASQIRERIGSYTSNIPEWLRQPLIPLAYASTNWGITSTGSTSYPYATITHVHGPDRGVWSSGSTITVTLAKIPTNGHMLIATVATRIDSTGVKPLTPEKDREFIQFLPEIILGIADVGIRYGNESEWHNAL